MKKAIAIFVTFNPKIDKLSKNISSLIDDVFEVLIIDNGSDNSEHLDPLLLNTKIILIKNNKNLGIAHALNQGLNYSWENKYDYMLTMDQDSCFMAFSVPLLFSGFIDDSVAMVCPSLIDVNSSNIDTVNMLYENIQTTITSGCLCSVEKLNFVGGFESKLFIDYVDIELCLRLINAKFKIIRSKKSILYHELGNSEIRKILGLVMISTNHSAERRYFYARNKFYIYRKYLTKNFLFILRDFLSFCKTILIILFYEKQKNQKIKMICKGVYDGIFKMSIK